MAKKNPRVNIYGEPHRAVVLHVKSYGSDGRPRECSMLYEGETVQLRPGVTEELLIAFVKEAALTKKN